MDHPTDRIMLTTAFVTPAMEHWLERDIAQWVHPMKDQSDDPSHHERTLLPWSYISLPCVIGCVWVFFLGFFLSNEVVYHTLCILCIQEDETIYIFLFTAVTQNIHVVGFLWFDMY